MEDRSKEKCIYNNNVYISYDTLKLRLIIIRLLINFKQHFDQVQKTAKKTKKKKILSLFISFLNSGRPDDSSEFHCTENHEAGIFHVHVNGTN